MFRNILIVVLLAALVAVSYAYVRLSENCSAEIKALRSELGVTGIKDESDARSLKVETRTIDMVTVNVRFRYDNPEAGDAAAYRTCLGDAAKITMVGMMYEDFLSNKPNLSDFMNECGLHIKSVEYQPQL